MEAKQYCLVIYQADTITFSPEPSAHTGESWIVIDIGEVNPTGVNTVYTR